MVTEQVVFKNRYAKPLFELIALVGIFILLITILERFAFYPIS